MRLDPRFKSDRNGMLIHKGYGTDFRNGSVGCVILPEAKRDVLAGLVRDYGGASLWFSAQATKPLLLVLMTKYPVTPSRD
jgi:hypothetical protein